MDFRRMSTGEGIEVLWQCGKSYKRSVDAFMAKARLKGLGREASEAIRYSDFIGRMDLAYAAADVVISRSGASSISELCAVRKASIFVPSPNVAEDHQTHNAMALVNRGAALIVPDEEASDKLMSLACRTVREPETIASLEANIAPLARPDAARSIVDEVYKLL